MLTALDVVVDAVVVLVVGDVDVVVDTAEAVVVVSAAAAAALHHPSVITTRHSRAAGRRMIDPQEACSYGYGRYPRFVRRAPVTRIRWLCTCCSAGGKLAVSPARYGRSA